MTARSIYFPLNECRSLFVSFVELYSAQTIVKVSCCFCGGHWTFYEIGTSFVVTIKRARFIIKKGVGVFKILGHFMHLQKLFGISLVNFVHKYQKSGTEAALSSMK